MLLRVLTEQAQRSGYRSWISNQKDKDTSGYFSRSCPKLANFIIAYSHGY
jgi:hypothetical protein